MIWNEEGPLELLKGMPHVLTAENLAQIQQVIDNDKFLNSQKLRGDLCGVYAPFCKNCDKSVMKPCAVAYVRMKIKEGMEVQMEDIPDEAPVVEEEVKPAPAKVKSLSSKKIRIAVAKKKA